ncbi:leucyl aminopeptidase family protein [Ferruginivarius sediminum]|uniref:Leucyl aminopeptidase family protein n=1 Tax=Ferruginivarius sediminum TaxID=2661937 RepID=A0A369T961_9PROT|nr:leucyl aminopeptidase family protein [Ferruginivarius sediminum]RDD60707.1 leucyl aminopeptidase family protein [Ferruginivarius sediminum]
MEYLVDSADATTLPITPIAPDTLKGWLAGQPARVAAWVHSSGFTAKAGTHTLVPDDNGEVERVLLGVERRDDIWAYAGLPTALPSRRYSLDPEVEEDAVNRAVVGWAMGCYAFDRYKKREAEPAQLVWPESADRATVRRTVEACTLVRDLINTPASDLGPEELGEAVRAEGKRYGAKTQVIAGEQLLKRNYPAIHAVGRASAREPRLVDLRWSNGEGPRITIVGKGVCFDTGGLDLKPASGMKLMKKDMGGAAHALALAKMVMGAELPVRLRLLIPAVENSVSGDAFRPQDIIQTRKGLTVEIGNTDAEGRLVLADALAEAERDKPDLVIDFATLTGAARSALGPDLPALFSNDDALAKRLLDAGEREQDPVWRLPLFDPYRKWLDSPVADLNNVAEGPFAGAIVAALFLREFAPKDTPWAHFDLMGWNTAAKPGRPKGGEAMSLRAAFAALNGWVAEHTS